jgi:hypothetical protein
MAIPVVEGGQVQGYVYSYSWSFEPFAEGRLELLEEQGWGVRRVQHSLWVR